MAMFGKLFPGFVLAAAALVVPGHPALAQAPAGVAAAVNPDATGTPPALPMRVLEVGSDLVQNERVATTAGGQAQLLFRDGSTVTLGPNSDLTIDSFVYDPSTKTGKLAMTAAVGVFRFVGGRASKDEPVVLNTPTATIGIRGGINFTSVVPGSTETTQAYGKSTTATSTTTGETQTLSKNGFTMVVAANQPITTARIDMGRINAMLAGLQGAPGKSGGATSTPNQSSPAATGLTLANSAQSPLSIQASTAGLANGLTTSTSSLSSALSLATQTSQATAQSIVSGTAASSVGSVVSAESFLSALGNGAFNFAAAGPFLRGVNNFGGTGPNPTYPGLGTIGGDSYSGFTSTVGPGSGGTPVFNAIDNASGSASRNFSFNPTGSVDLSASYSRSFARTTTGGSPIYSYTETFSVSRSLTGGTLAEFGGDSQAVFVRISGPSITFSATTTLTASGSFPSTLVPGTTTFGPETIKYPSSESLHLLLGVPASLLPSGGQYSYQLLGATSPTFTDGSGSPGKFSGSMQILFGAVPTSFYTNNAGQPLFTSYSSSIPGFTVGLNFNVTIPGDGTYSGSTIGGAASPAQQLSFNSNTQGVVISQGPFGQPYRFAGMVLIGGPSGLRACPSGGAGCGGSITGVLFSQGGTHAGFAYFIGAFQGSTPGITGVALFRR